MSELPPRKRIRDVPLMRALAHPTRTALLNYLMATGPRTASECASAVGSTPSNCSWHLRQLAAYGLVERSDTGDGRERPWRAAQVGLDLGAIAHEGSTRSAQFGVFAAQLGEEQALAQRFLDTADELEQPWRDSGGVNTYSLRVTPDELEGLRAAIDGLLRPYVATIRTDAPPGARPVHAGVRAFLRIEADGKPSS